MQDCRVKINTSTYFLDGLGGQLVFVQFWWAACFFTVWVAGCWLAAGVGWSGGKPGAGESWGHGS